MPFISKKQKAASEKILLVDGVEHVPVEKTGVVFLGRIPHGFYEDEMRSYFSQFGTVLRIRLSRNKKVFHEGMAWELRIFLQT
jgi:nucleolar protein 15